MELITLIIAIAIALGVGMALGYFLLKSGVKKEKELARQDAQKILEEAAHEAASLKKDKLLEVKEKYIQLKEEYENDVSRKNKKLDEREKQIKDKESALTSKTSDLQKRENEITSLKEDLRKQLELLETKKEDLDKAQQEHISRLEQVARLSKEDAKAELIENLQKEAETEALAHVKNIIDEAKLKASREAKKIIIQTIQRTAAEQAVENSVSVFNLDSDDQKGQIIGREGRNIRALEAACGVDIIVDDTPEAIVISGFDSVRRELARLSLQRLVADGRIHPARIEEVVAKTRKEMEEHIMEIGERTVIELNIHGLHPQLVRMVGRMRFRSSYGQNLLQHSRETANLCAVMAAELGLNPRLAKRAGLLHDIGKVPEEETELSHALLGMKLAEKYGEHAAVCNAIGAHHDEIPMEYAVSPIVQACDAISGARPGARRETMENYMQRLKDLEKIAMEYDGVQKAYAIQAGRELRVIAESERISDKDADELAFKISEKIQAEMTYPGQVKVTVIREKRAISFAK